MKNYFDPKCKECTRLSKTLMGLCDCTGCLWYHTLDCLAINKKILNLKNKIMSYLDYAPVRSNPNDKAKYQWYEEMAFKNGWIVDDNGELED